MKKSFAPILAGYQTFRQKYVLGDQSVMQYLSDYGQKPEIMVISCCDSRVDPALIFQCDPGDLFVVRNVANIVPPFEKDEAHHGTSAALEFGITVLNVKNLIILGHSQCGGIQALCNGLEQPNDFILNWVSIVKSKKEDITDVDLYTKSALEQSYKNCFSFPWIANRVQENKLAIHTWFFDIQTGKIFVYDRENNRYYPL